MTEKKKVEDAADDAVDKATDDATDDSTDTTEDENWARMKTMIGETVEEKLTAWQSKQPKKTTSTPSQKKAAAPKRKQGFLTRGFFSAPTDDAE